MKVVRRASLVFSLVLIVAIAVGYVARTSELERGRDRALTAASELGAAHLKAIIEATEVAARSATDTAMAAESLASVHTGIGVCVVSTRATTCSGDGPSPARGDRIEVSRRRALIDAEAAAGDDEDPGDDPETEVVVYDSLMTIRADGPELSVLVTAPVDVMSATASRQSVWATTLLPVGGRTDGFTVDQGVRKTSASVDAASGLYVVAARNDAIALPVAEFRLYLLIFLLALVLMTLAGVTIYFEQRNLHERASVDPLTKLPNRGEFERRAADVLRDGRAGDAGCLLLFDLNGFKQVNDTFGHIAGDEVLRVVGERLRKAVRDDDIVARWGGDEFVVAMPGVATVEMGGRRAGELAEQIGGRTRLETVDASLRVKVSVGVAVWPDHGRKLDDLVLAADRAMYEAKREGVTCRIAKPAPTEVKTLLAVRV